MRKKGYSHQDPMFINNMVNLKGRIVRVYLPPDANTLLCVLERCLQSVNKVNLVVATKGRCLCYCACSCCCASTVCGLAGMNGHMFKVCVS